MGVVSVRATVSDPRIEAARVVRSPPAWRLFTATVALATARAPDGQVVEGVGARLVGEGRAVAAAERSALAMLDATDLSYRVGTVVDARGNTRVGIDRSGDRPRVTTSRERSGVANVVSVTADDGDAATTTVGKAVVGVPFVVDAHHRCLRSAVSRAERELSPSLTP